MGVLWEVPLFTVVQVEQGGAKFRSDESQTSKQAGSFECEARLPGLG